MQSELQRLETEPCLLHSSAGFTSFTEMRVEVKEPQGSSEDSTALCGPLLGLLLDAVQPSKVREQLIACFLPAFPPFHPTKHLET